MTTIAPKKPLSVSKVSSGLLSQTKDHYNEGIAVYERLQEQTYNDAKLNGIIMDFPKFESVILQTKDNQCHILSKTQTVKEKTRDLINNHNLRAKKE